MPGGNIVTGFDAGASHLGMVTLQRQGSHYRIRSLAFSPASHPSLDSDFSKTYRQFCRTHRIRPRNLVAGLSGRELMIRYTKMPVVPDWKLSMMMEFELEEQVSSFAKKAYAAYRKMRLPGLRQQNVMMLGMVSQSYLDFLLTHVPKISQFNFNALGLFGAGLVSPQVNPDETVMLIDIGAESTEVVICRDQMLLFARHIQYGGKNYDSDVAIALGIEPSKAEQNKISRGNVHPDTHTDKKLYTPLYASTRMLCTHIASALQFGQEYIGESDMHISSIVLTGGASQLPGLSEVLSRRFRVPTTYLDLSDVLDMRDLSKEQSRIYSESLHSLHGAIGLAVAELHSQGARINPMPQDIIRRRRFVSHELYLIVALVIFFLSIMIWGGVLIERKKSLDRDIALRRSLVNSMDALDSSVSKEIAEYTVYRTMETDIGGRIFSGERIMHIFRIISETLPPSVRITRFTTKKEPLSSNTLGRRKRAVELTDAYDNAIYVSGEVYLGSKKTIDPHQLLSDYIHGLLDSYSEFSAFTPLEMQYRTEKRDRFYFKLEIILSEQVLQ